MAGYNGWENYETWNVSLHFMDSFDGETSRVSADTVEEMVDEYISSGGFTRCAPFIGDIIQSFMGEVKWQEIADAINRNNDIADEDEDEDEE